MADHDQAARVLTEEVTQPGDRIGVQMIRRLVEQQGGRLPCDIAVREQDAGQLDSTALAARQRPQRLPEHPIRQAEVGTDPRGFALRGIAAEVGEAMFELPVAPHQGLVIGRLGQLDLDLGDVGDELVEPSSGQHPVPSRDVQIPGARVLGQVPDRATALDSPPVGSILSGQGAQRRRLAGTVAAHQADAVSRLNAQRGRREQDPSARAQLQVGGGDHECCS